MRTTRCCKLVASSTAAAVKTQPDTLPDQLVWQKALSSLHVSQTRTWAMQTVLSHCRTRHAGHSAELHDHS